MARSGQVRQRVSEEQLIMLLDQVDQVGANESANKITVRATTVLANKVGHAKKDVGRR